jgi:(+)-trans-carveol dehydrogenase
MSTDRTAFITGTARGIGLAIAQRLAADGYSIIAADRAEQPEASPEWCVVSADISDQDSIDEALSLGIRERGAVDVVCACAGVFEAIGPTWEIAEDEWKHVVDIDLNGTWRTVKAVMPGLIERGNGGSIVLVNSVGGMHGVGQTAAYTAAKHGVTGLLRSLVNEVSTHGIRVNSVHPTTVDTQMIHNDALYSRFLPDVENPTREEFAKLFTNHNALPVPWVEARDVAEAVAWLVSDAARYVTGVQLPVDAGSPIGHGSRRKNNVSLPSWPIVGAWSRSG